MVIELTTADYFRVFIAVAIQVDDMKEEVDSCSWDLVPVEAKSPCPTVTSAYSMQSRMEVRGSGDIAIIPNLQYEADSESLGTLHPHNISIRLN